MTNNPESPAPNGDENVPDNPGTGGSDQGDTTPPAEPSSDPKGNGGESDHPAGP